ncbi:peptidase M61 [Phenylobacterium kunshanense]|uniref:Peptidase M61 n=1 Tax=Phenylobacterium kunshanense TaxID=1445034 RepID=A0A328BFU8_9CAUL|nr:peptidase M61 [Phenylobacterium kunshanense]RAK66352.1 peptidase M61 [Phenylobacterium kunshanense]
MRRLSFVLAAAAAATAVHAQTPPELRVRLAPGPMDQTAGKGFVDVTLTVPQVDAAEGAPLLTLPVVIANTDTVANTLTGLKAVDALGEVPLTVKDDPVAIAYARRWLAGRAVKGDVTVTYRAPVDNTPPTRGSGPPYSLRTEGGGVSGVGNTFILLPEGGRSYRIALTWDLTRLGAGAKAMSSLGEGDVRLEPGPVERLHRSLFMAGDMRRVPAEVKPTGFSAAWLGDPPFDPRPLMTWAGELHGWMSGFFQDPTQPPYRVILRYNPINAGGGAALANSFLLTWGETAKDPEGLKGTLAHEMIHTWTAGGLGGQWYGEGIAVHYQALLPLRAGLIKPEAYLEDINDTARRYYTNALNDTPDDQIAPRFWEDTRIRVLPYDRGAMYFAVLDGKIRRASGGKRSLDELVIEMSRRRRVGEPVTDAVWLELLDGALGPEGRKVHADMLAGRLMLPEAGDFGPCFTRTTARFRRFELGFEPKSLVGAVKTIRGVQPGSEAAKAGLRDGDVVTYAAALDGVQGDQKRTLTLNVTRDGRTFPITYLPRGELVEAWQWRRVPGVPDGACGN